MAASEITGKASGMATCEPETASSSASVVCDLAEGKAFSLGYAMPNVPVLAAFGGERLHSYKLEGSWDLERAAKENAAALFRSVRRLAVHDAPVEWDDLTFQFGPRAFVYVDKNQLVGFASSLREAERLVREFSKTCSVSPAPSGGTFYLIEQSPHGIRCEPVILPPATLLATEILALHYGRDTAEWHEGFVDKLNRGVHGLSILEGQPGTGKTFYLRHLMGVLRGSHRFYFIPTPALGVLSRPDFVGFWADQRRSHANRKFVVVLEDSDAALMRRGSDNREEVSALLNLSDGLLGNFLRLQIICTINCAAGDIDPALLRPGRLLCHRVFHRLDYAQAARLAESLGRTLPAARDYSLAEVYAGNERPDLETNRPRIGFANSPGN